MKKKLNSKRKGNSWELQVSKILNEFFDTDKFRRVPSSGGFIKKVERSTLEEGIASALVGDIICPMNFKFIIEAKSYSDFNIFDLLNNEEVENNIDKWISQVSHDAKAVNKEWLIFVKINMKKPFVILKKALNPFLDKSLIYKDKYSIIRLDYFLNLFDKDYFFEEVDAVK